MSSGVSLGKSLEMRLGGDVDELDEFGGAFAVCLLHLVMLLMSLEIVLMILGVGLEQELGDEFGGDFDEFDEFGGHFLVWLREKRARLVSLAVRLMNLERGFGAG